MKLARKPTQAAPGSAEKIAVMCLRFERKQSCFHPDDRRIEWERYTPRSDNVSLSGLMETMRESFRDRSDGDD
jgi:hypothetical protein